MHLDHLSLTGIDDDTDLHELLDMQQAAAPAVTVEWGLLSMKGKSGGKYPSKKTVARVRAFADKGLNVCAHLCGADAKSVLRGTGIPEHVAGFRRYQLNIGSYESQWDPVGCPPASFGLPLEAGYTLQCGKNRWVMDGLAPAMQQAGYRVSLLFDTSRGRGKKGDNWALADGDVLCGFAGGITPETLGYVLVELLARKRRFFVCAESGLRTADRFDPDKLRACIEVCKRFAEQHG